MRWRRLVATPVGTTLVLSTAILAPGAFAANANTPARPGSVAASGNGSEQPATAPAPPQPPGPLPSVDELEAQMLSMVNAERAAAGVGAVQQVGWSHSVARQHAQDMAAAGDIWHNIAGFINRGHGALRATYLGENVAMDSTLAADDALLYSDIPHRNVTLDRLVELLLEKETIDGDEVLAVAAGPADSPQDAATLSHSAARPNPAQPRTA